MAITKRDVMSIGSSEDVVRVRQAVREWAIERGFSLVDQTKIITAASELARNTVDYGGGGGGWIDFFHGGGRGGGGGGCGDRGGGGPANPTRPQRRGQRGSRRWLRGGWAGRAFTTIFTP